MRVLLTGAAGVLGQALRPLLAEEHEVTATDLALPDNRACFVRADLRDQEQVQSAMAGHEAVVHVAALHPWKPYTDAEYCDSNLRGTWNVLSAAVEAGCRRVVFTSTIWAIGHDPDPPPYVPVDEQAPARPLELYGYTKYAGERMCEMFSRLHGLETVCLRVGTFVPARGPRQLWELLWGRIAIEDVAAVHLAAVNAPVHGPHVFFAQPSVPFQPADAAGLAERPAEVIERYFPGAKAAMQRDGVTPPPIRWWWSSAKAKRLLGWEPRRSFGDVWRSGELE
ncbi:MAG: NAD-dependent epimerase/dehydratase family protein [Armatimonadota bacterium]